MKRMLILPFILFCSFVHAEITFDVRADEKVSEEVVKTVTKKTFATIYVDKNVVVKDLEIPEGSDPIVVCKAFMAKRRLDVKTISLIDVTALKAEPVVVIKEVIGEVVK